MKLINSFILVGLLSSLTTAPAYGAQENHSQECEAPLGESSEPTVSVARRYLQRLLPLESLPQIAPSTREQWRHRLRAPLQREGNQAPNEAQRNVTSLVGLKSENQIKSYAF